MLWLVRIAMGLAGTLLVLLGGGLLFLLVSMLLNGADLRQPGDVAVYFVVAAGVLGATGCALVVVWRRVLGFRPGQR